MRTQKDNIASDHLAVEAEILVNRTPEGPVELRPYEEGWSAHNREAFVWRNGIGEPVYEETKKMKIEAKKQERKAEKKEKKSKKKKKHNDKEWFSSETSSDIDDYYY